MNWELEADLVLNARCHQKYVPCRLSTDNNNKIRASTAMCEVSRVCFFSVCGIIFHVPHLLHSMGVCVVHSMIFFFFVLLQLLSSSPSLLQPRIDSVRVYISCVQVSVTSYAFTCWHKMQINKHNERLSIEYPPPVNWRALERTAYCTTAQQRSRDELRHHCNNIVQCSLDASRSKFNFHQHEHDRISCYPLLWLSHNPRRVKHGPLLKPQSPGAFE